MAAIGTPPPSTPRRFPSLTVDTHPEPDSPGFPNESSLTLSPSYITEVTIPGYQAVPLDGQGASDSLALIPPLSPTSRDRLLTESLAAGSESFCESPDGCFFLRRLLWEATSQVNTWRSFAELSRYEARIAQFYLQELCFRKLDPENASSLGWAQLDGELQGYDRDNLSRIMNVVLPILCQQNLIYVPCTVSDLENRQKKEVAIDCFNLLWRVTYCPLLLNRVTELDFSNIELKEIPLSFCRLYFPRLKKLSFSQNPLEKLPEAFYEEVPNARVIYFLTNFPKLEVLDLSGCRLTTIDGVFSFPVFMKGLEERISVPSPLKEVDFSENRILSFPENFHISNQHQAKEITLRFSEFTRKKPLISPEALADLTRSSPIQITFDLRTARIVDDDLPASTPANVVFKIGPIKECIPNGFKPPIRVATEEKRSTFKRGDVIGV